MKTYIINAKERVFCPFLQEFETVRYMVKISAENKDEAINDFIENIADEKNITFRQADSGIKILKVTQI